jgi:23S rRNA pseudouridine1911/1915/1917 synthase
MATVGTNAQPGNVMNPPSTNRIDVVTRDTISQTTSGGTILAWLRVLSWSPTWSECRRLLAHRRVQINGVITVDEARRLKPGDVIELTPQPAHVPTTAEVAIVYEDADLVVVEKPSGVETTRRPEEEHWPLEKRLLLPTLEELTACRLIGFVPRWQDDRLRRTPGQLPRLPRVQRLDRPTTGLVVFPRHRAAADGLIAQFAAHTVERTYVAVVWGLPEVGTLRSQLVKDRGDGRRGSTRDPRAGDSAITQITVVQPITLPNAAGTYAQICCRLETGRTHQIRIHLAEQGHPLCGDPLYRGPIRTDVPDLSAAPRLALHAMTLGFRHPRTGEQLRFESTWPNDLAAWSPWVSQSTEGIAPM